ncbi:pyruvate dehydrogenase E1 component subunitalpha [Encephalitozoon romaleae SJ-2008]|uniref:Pyruvate dehydrogenase E1 component subunitalpha n=2 Tax=Encephalitozoon romaleae TaxID=571949 RepID=I7ATI0_ENCRO
MQEKRYIHCDAQGILNSIQTHGITKEEIDIVQKLEVDEMVYIYKQMMKIRLTDEIMDREYKEKSIRGFCHLSIGQEGIYAALEHELDGDMVISSYRCHGLAYVTGCKTLEILGEVLGKQAGVCKGKGGSMHLYNRNFFGGHGIVGAQVPLGLGISYALKYKGRLLQDRDQGNRVCYAFYGDGAANQGQVWESFNMAMIWRLPIVFVCENNRYGMWTSAESISTDTNFYLRGGTMPGIRIAHNNIFGLISVLRYARRYSSEKGPIIVQIDTYRLCTHSTADERESYRAKGEIDNERKNDCMEDTRNRLLAFCSREEIDAIKDRVLEEVERDVDTAKKSKPTEESELFKDILL